MKIFGILRPTTNGWVWEWVAQCPSTSTVVIPEYWMPLPEPPTKEKE